MSLTDFHHGVLYVKIDNGVRPIEVVRSSVIAVAGTAPDADPITFPINKNVTIIGRNDEKRTKIGSSGTLPWVLDGIFDQSNATVIVVRVPRAPSPKVSVLASLSNPMLTVNELVTRGSGDFDELANDDVAYVNSISMGNETYDRNTDWTRKGSEIHWKVYETTESVFRRSSTVDPLDHQENMLSILSVYKDETIYVEGTDYQLHSGTGGIEWLSGGNAPNVHDEYFVAYSHGKRPATGNTYETNYNYYQFSVADGEVVTRSETLDYDRLENYNILNLRTVYAGNETYVEDTDFELLDDQIHWITHDEVETLTRSTGDDSLAHADDVINVDSVYQGATIYTKDVDWTVVNGAISWISGNQPLAGQNYSVSYSWGHRPANGTDYQVDYTYKTGEITAISEIIGGVSVDTGFYEGVHTFFAAPNEVFLTPKIMIAPGFTQYVDVSAEMLGVAEELLAVVIADGPNKTNVDAISFRREFGNKRLYIVDPYVQFWNTQTDGIDFQPPSARVAGLINKIDNEKGWWHSPSNNTINGISGTARPIPKTGGVNSVSNYLNENEVNIITATDQGGYHLWGNRTCSPEPLYWFISSVRTDDMIQESLTLGIQWAIDKTIDKTFFENVSESVNLFCRSLAAQGAIILGDQNPCWVDPKLNTPDQIIQGNAVFNFDYERNYPAEKITLRRYINHDYLKTIFANSTFVRSA